MQNKNIDYHSLGTKIKRKREELSLTQEKLAEKCDISSSFLYHIEAGTRVLSVETLYKIANALNVSFDYLLLDTTMDSDNFLVSISEVIKDKQPNYNTFCKVMKVLAENIESI